MRIRCLRLWHQAKSKDLVFEFLGAYYAKVEKELKNITGTDKKTEYIIIKCQKWLLSQNNETTKNSTGLYNDYNSVTCNAETTKHRCHPHCCKRKYIKGKNKNKDTIIVWGIYLAPLLHEYKDSKRFTGVIGGLPYGASGSRCNSYLKITNRI